MTSKATGDLDWRGTCRLWARGLWLSAALVACIPPHLVCKLVRRRSPWSRLYLRAAARACGARVECVGQPLRRNVFFVANHLSWIDIPILGGLVDTAFVSQDKIADWPIVGSMAKLNNTIFVSRTDRRTAGDQVERLRAAIATPQPVTLFPEGTTTDGNSLLPFKSVLFEGLVPPPPGLMIQPVVLDFDPAGKALAWIGTETGGDNGRRTLSQPGSFDVRVHFLEPFDPAGHDRKSLAAEVRARIAAALATTVGHPIA